MTQRLFFIPLSRVKCSPSIFFRAFGVSRKSLLLPLVMVLQIFIAYYLSPTSAQAQTTVAFADVPMLALKSAPGLVMLTMSRDQRLFYKAYDDSSDIDGDGMLDVGFKPKITYYGYFASDRCYAYVSDGGGLFSPKSLADATDGCSTAPSGARWHGNWLNWATMSRMDTLRRVLYGGYRETDPSSSSSLTVLRGAFIPRDAHVWGKEYRPTSGRDLGVYLIQNYTPLDAPTSGKQHLFIVRSDNVTEPSGTYTFPMPVPKLRVITNADQTTERIWNWAAGDGSALGANNPSFTTFGGASYSSVAYAIRVEACVALSGAREANCTAYGKQDRVWKPTGVLHDFSVKDSLKYGLLTGSYLNNYSGGVVRRNIASFSEEINQNTGQWQNVTEGNTSVPGIARTIDRMVIFGWNGVDQYNCGASFTAPRKQGDCPAWGAPIAEMMYEGLRYFSGKASPTSAYFNGLTTTPNPDSRLGLPLMGTSGSPWKNPYRPQSAGGNPICSKPVQMLIADPVTSYDSDQLPGAYFPLIGGSASVTNSDMTGWGSGTLSLISQGLWNAEGLGTRNIFIGQSGAIADGNPTAKSASSFFNIRGHAPDGAMAQGSYYAAAVANFGRYPSVLGNSFNTGIDIGAPSANPSVPTVRNQQVDTLSIALGSVVPKIRIPSDVNRTRYATIVPIAKSVANLSINKNPGAYQATGTITGFYLNYSYNTTGTSGPDYDATQNGGRPMMSFAVNFSDSDEGTDNESDAIVRYDVYVDSQGKLIVKILPVQTNIAGIQMQIGFVVSGTTKDGLYLDLRTQAGSQIYYLDTLAGQDPAPVVSPYRSNSAALPATTTTRSLGFSTTGVSSANYMPHDPLWYAAKYGGAGQIDSKGDPANYFEVTSPDQLPDQMGKAFRAAASLAAVANTSVVGVGSRSLGNAALYQANYDSLTWTSRVYAFPITSNGTVSNTALWEAGSSIPTPTLRSPVSAPKVFLGRGATSRPIALTSGGFANLTAAEQVDFGDSSVYEYLLGNKSLEERKGCGACIFRNRGATLASENGSVLGDIVNSDPQVISRKDYGYGLNDPSYTTFLASIVSESLAVNANDGFFHVFDAAPTASGGGELFAFMPQAARTDIKKLASKSYQHRYLLDGPVTLAHAKISVPGDVSVAWRSVAVATGGQGAQTVFAINTQSQSYSANSVLWEINQNTTLPIPGTLGHVVGRPAIGQLRNGTWVTIFGNGYNSNNGTANLLVVRLDNGAVLKQFKTDDAKLNNGLGSVELVLSTNGSKTIDYVYAADYKGNIWRFNLSAVNLSDWPENGALIYSTPAGRNITGEIKVSNAPVSANTPPGGYMVSFGTGSFLSAADVTDTTVQALYGIYDDLLGKSYTSAAVVESNLVVQSILMSSATSDTRSTSAVNNSTNLPWYLQTGNKKGWVVPLSGINVTPGERVIAPPVRYTVPGALDVYLFTSIVPGTDPCVSGLDVWITGLDASTGGFARAFDQVGLASVNSIKISGGSPRGVFVLQDGVFPQVYIARTGAPSAASYNIGSGANITTCIGGTCSNTGASNIALRGACVGSACVGAAGYRTQFWRQLK